MSLIFFCFHLTDISFLSGLIHLFATGNDRLSEFSQLNHNKGFNYVNST